MNLDDFLALLTDELGMAVAREDLDKHLDQVADWDSAHLVELLALLERDTGHAVSLPDVLSASSLAEIHRIAVAGGA